MPVLRHSPCLSNPADPAATGSKVVTISHHGYRLMARADPRAAAAAHVLAPPRWSSGPVVTAPCGQVSCLIDGEVVCCDERGLARFDVLRRRRNEVQAFLYAFDLLERRYRFAPRAVGGPQGHTRDILARAATGYVSTSTWPTTAG